MDGNFETGLLSLVVAMAISMALIPLLIYFAPALGMMDKPDPRKVHSEPIARVGGIGIVLGALLPVVIWLPWNDLIVSYLMGSVVLLVFGVWDDSKELGHYVKFVGQFIAVLAVVFYGDLYVSHLPFMGMDPIDETIGRFIAVIGMVGIINAINHSDGLDGLAGGESLLSLGAIIYLASQVDDSITILIALATVGGVFGFLRFNSHPARVFMGDGGSQFLGFTLGFLALYLTQSSNQALSPALPALLLGLPVVDIVAVLIKRARGGMNLFRASKNHVHHRLLALGFHHYESVMVIYSVQVLFVAAAVLMPYESDMLIIGFYILISSLLFSYLNAAEKNSWYLYRKQKDGKRFGLSRLMSPGGPLASFNNNFVQGLLSIFLVVCSLAVTDVPGDLAVVAGLLFVFLLTRLIFGYKAWFLFLRLILFVAVAFAAYLLEFYPPDFLKDFTHFGLAFFSALAIGVVFAVRLSQVAFFQVTPLDYLVLIVVLALVLMSETGYADASAVKIGLQLIVLFYGVEVVIKSMQNRANIFTVSTLVFLAVIAVRGLV